MKHGRTFLITALLATCLAGCAAEPYRYGAADVYRISPELIEETPPQIERGKPRPIIDGIGWVFGIPSKIILWDRRIENHNISPETENAMAKYLAVNELETVKVRLNQYAPFQEWDRLVANKSVGWGWRYTVGTLSWLEYTLLPGRLFGGDHYNAFTNTINLYSDVPAVAVHEGGHAKDFARRTWKGTYAVIYGLPGAPLWYEAIATNDAISYFHNEGTLEEEQEAYRILYPAYGTYVGNSIADFSTVNGGIAFAAAVIPAHVLGRMKARRAASNRPANTEMELDQERLPYVAPVPEYYPEPMPMAEQKLNFEMFETTAAGEIVPPGAGLFGEGLFSEENVPSDPTLLRSMFSPLTNSASATN